MFVFFVSRGGPHWCIGAFVVFSGDGGVVNGMLCETAELGRLVAKKFCRRSGVCSMYDVMIVPHMPSGRGAVHAGSNARCLAMSSLVQASRFGRSIGCCRSRIFILAFAFSPLYECPSSFDLLAFLR